MSVVSNAALANSGVSSPLTIDDLRLLHNEECESIRRNVSSIESELAGTLSRGERLELASGVKDAADELAGLYRKKEAAGYFEGFKAVSERCLDRLAHLKSDYRRLLNELLQAEHEITSGKLQKARRQLSHWLSHFGDVLDRESDVVRELSTAESDRS